MELIEILKALADETRLRILNILLNGDFCVCDLETTLELSQPNASKHLNKLKNAKIIKASKKAQWVYYSINNTLLNEFPFIHEILRNDLSNDIFVEDLTNLTNYLKRKKGCEI